MPQKSENLPPNWDDINNECQHITLKCPWTLTSGNGTIKVVIACLKWTFIYDFWIRVTADPEGNPNFSKQICINKHNPLLVSLSEALNDYEDFPEAHLNFYQLHILGEVLDSLFRRYNPHNCRYSSSLSWSSHRKTSWHRSRSGRQSFIQLIERKMKNQLCSWRRTCRCWWTCKLYFQEKCVVFFFTSRTSRWVVRE